jgi:hypothetical protein
MTRDESDTVYEAHSFTDTELAGGRFEVNCQLKLWPLRQRTPYPIRSLMSRCFFEKRDVIPCSELLTE